MNRRTDKRTTLKVPCLIYINNKQYTGKVHDISRSGISFKLNATVNIDEELNFSFLYGNTLVTGTCSMKNVRYKDNGATIGCKLLSVNSFDFVNQTDANYMSYKPISDHIYHVAS